MSPVRTPVLDDLVGGGAHHEGDVLCCAFAPGPLWAASGGWDGQVLQWDLNTGQAGAWWRAAEKAVSALAIAPDASRIWTGDADGILGLWDAASHANVFRFMAHMRPISGIALSPDGLWLATSSWDGTVVLRTPERPDQGRVLTGHRDVVAGCRAAPDGKRLLTWSHDRTAVLWDIQQAHAAAHYGGHPDRLMGADISPNGEFVATGSRDGTMILWRTDQRHESARYFQEGEFRACFFTPDGDLLISLWGNGDLVGHSIPGFEIVLELPTGLAPQCGGVFCMGAPLAAGGGDGRLNFLQPDALPVGPLWITASEAEAPLPTPGLMSRLMHKPQTQRVLRCTCPICRCVFALAAAGDTACPQCHRLLRVNKFTLTLPPAPQAVPAH